MIITLICVDFKDCIKGVEKMYSAQKILLENLKVQVSKVLQLPKFVGMLKKIKNKTHIDF